jgi:hypothetical protein
MVKGILHGESDSRRTSFIEPEETTYLNNEIFSLENEERKEVNIILRKLTSKIRSYHSLLTIYHGIIGEYDFIRAKAMLALDYNGNLPALHDKAMVKLVNAFHPLLFIYNEKLKKPTAADMIILSIGTGSVKKKYKFDDFKNAGEIKWLEPVIDILMSGNAETVAYQLTQMYLTLEPENQKNYYRLEPELKEGCSEMDIATPENINNLYQAGLSFVHDNKHLLEQIAASILEND